MFWEIKSRSPRSFPLSCRIRSPPVISPATLMLRPKKSFSMAYTRPWIPGYFSLAAAISFSKKGAAETPVAMEKGVCSGSSESFRAEENSVSIRRSMPTPFSSWT